LIEQAKLMRSLTERMLLAAGIGRGMHVLDTGSGVGDVSFLVAALAGAEGSAICSKPKMTAAASGRHEHAS